MHGAVQIPRTILAFFLVVFIAQVSSVKSEIVPNYPSKCPRIHLIQDFNLPSYLGPWYEIMRSAQQPYTCGVWHNKAMGNGSYIGNFTAMYENSTIFTKLFTYDMIDEKKFPPGVLTNFEKSPDDQQTPPNYLLGYEHVVIVFVCYLKDQNIIEKVRIYAKKPDADLEDVFSILAENNLLHIPLRYTYVNCPENM